MFDGANPMQVILVTATMANVPLIGLVSLPAEHRVTFAMRMAEQP